MKQVFARKIVWLFLFLGLLNFLFHFAMVYMAAELKAHTGLEVPRMVDRFDFTGSGRSYRNFISYQGTLVMVLLAFSGAVLVGNDFRFRAVAFYLSRPVTKVHYFLGKLAAASGIAALITLVPAVVLFFEYGAFTDSLDYYWKTRGALLAILAYGALVSVASATVLLGVAALLQRTLPILIGWGAVFVLLPGVERAINAAFVGAGSEGWAWGVINFWRVLRWAGNLFFDIDREIYFERLPWTAASLAAWIGVSLWLFWRRVHAVEVVR
jgi:hypothetical protein